MTPGDDRYLHANGVRLRFRDEGEGPAVVLLHGWTLDLEIWEPQARDLARDLRVIRPDRRGFGLSAGTPDAAADAADLEALLDHLRVTRATVVGMSQGARAAIAFALRHPERVPGLVLDGPPGAAAGLAGGDEQDYSFDEFRRLAQSAGLDAFRGAWRAHPLMRLHTSDAGAQRLLARVLARYPGRDLLENQPALAAKVAPAALGRFSMPLLVINGALDTPQRLSAGEHFCRLLPRVERTLIPGAGHVANLDNPPAYNEVIRQFLRRQSRVAA